MTDIAILDGFTTNPGDNPWTPLQKFGELSIYDRTPDDKILERASGADIVLTNKTPLRQAHFDQLDALQYVSVLATGYDVVDIEAATEAGVPVSNVPEYSTDSVAEHTFGLLLELTHRVGLHDRAVHDGEWTESPDFSFWKRPISELKGKTLGLVGFGQIGSRVGRIASAFGMSVVATTHNSSPQPEWGPFELLDSVEAVFESADFVSLHCPLTESTRQLVGSELLRALSDNAYLVNTARGELVDEEALAKALEMGHLAGAAVDVVSEEPIEGDNPLLGAPNCVITPHIAWTSLEARERLMQTTANNIQAFLDGEPTNVVNDV